jgi:hypothetical protein
MAAVAKDRLSVERHVRLNAAARQKSRDLSACEKHLGAGAPGRRSLNGVEGRQNAGLARRRGAGHRRSDVVFNAEHRPVENGSRLTLDLRRGARRSCGCRV